MAARMHRDDDRRHLEAAKRSIDRKSGLQKIVDGTARLVKHNLLEFDAMERPSVNFYEWWQLVTRSNPFASHEESVQLFQKIDDSGEGLISKEEFTLFVAMDALSRLDQLQLKRLFKELDVDGSGELTFDEFVALLATLGIEDEVVARELFRRCDLGSGTNKEDAGDGNITYIELARWAGRWATELASASGTRPSNLGMDRVNGQEK